MCWATPDRVSRRGSSARPTRTTSTARRARRSSASTPTLNFSSFQGVGSAYTNNFNGTAVTTLFGIDSNRDVLVMQGGPNGVPSPNGGGLTTIGGGLGFNTSALVGFDISGTTGVAFASLVPSTGGPAQLFTINLTTGAATLVGTIGTGLTLTGLAAGVGAVPTVPVPSSLVLLGTGTLVLIAWARRRLAAAT